MLFDQIPKDGLADVMDVLELVELGVQKVEDGGGVEEVGFGGE